MDRRRYDREPTRLKVYARPSGSAARVLRASDISSEGVFLEGWLNAPSCGTELRITFVIDAGPIPRLLHRRAQVARVTSTGVGLTHTAIAPVPVPTPATSPWSSLRWPEVE